ncbi:Ribonuclease H domain [Arabidopsis thaliana x Arabidopsis arenosa]|uniref:Ribonuclease H domain n=1 Tax=Arabidopsis thaliana x Arabidopsis arenosa TaxID=1240361 RepID=A0A8T2DSB8_9BRAS|nr:Ribonuclease H domain [Arabidopsis thaliana x Arabidopsis arenosa]
MNLEERIMVNIFVPKNETIKRHYKEVYDTTLSPLNHDSKAGICLILTDSHGKYILKGCSSIEPTNSALEAEAIALKEALLQVKCLQYQDVIL